MKVATFLPLVLAATSTVATSLTRSYDVVRARQVKVQRDLLDVCVGLDVDVEIGSIIRDGLLFLVVCALYLRADGEG